MTKVKDTIGKMSDVRTSNNRLWMRILEIALTHAPDEAKAVLREINANDRKVGALSGKLAR